MAPNILDDPKIKFRIGGKYCQPLQDHNLAAESGNYIFSKPELLYDGI